MVKLPRVAGAFYDYFPHAGVLGFLWVLLVD